MKLLMILPCLLFLVACGSGEDTAIKEKPTVAEKKIVAPVVKATPEVSNAKLPFDLPIMPGARYISGSLKFSRPTKKRGGEAIATIAAKGTPIEVVTYYEKTLADIGFTPKVGKHNSESTAKVIGEHENGQKLSITSMRGGSKAKAGESQTSIIATKPL